MTESFDYSEFNERATVGDNLMGSLTALVDQLEAAESEVERLQKLLDEAKANAKRIAEKDIPDLMDGIEGSLTLKDGREVQIKEHIRASISGEKKIPAIIWLDKNGFGSLVKRKFTIEFGKDQEKWADQFEKQLANRKKPLNVKREKSVHPQTLTAFVKEKLEEGVDLPKDTFGIFRQRIAKIKD